MLLELDINKDRYEFASDIDTALVAAESEMSTILSKLDENTITLKKITPECDRMDYVLSVCSGILCGVVDIFLVGEPGESPVGNITEMKCLGKFISKQN